VGIPVINQSAKQDLDAERIPEMLHTNYRTLGFIGVRGRI